MQATSGDIQRSCFYRRALLPRAFPDYFFRPTHSPTHQIIEDIPVELRHSVGGALSRRMAISHVFKFSRLFVPQANGLFLFSMHFGTDCTRRKARRADHATQHLLMQRLAAFSAERLPCGVRFPITRVGLQLAWSPSRQRPKIKKCATFPLHSV